jgi:peptidoglycan hydrolase-like protein with peptidoglycan-binding domain
VTQLANTLKRAKEVLAAPEAAKYLTGLCAAADREKNDVAKAKAEADKAQIAADKAKLTADKAQLKADKAKAAADNAEAKQKKDDDVAEGKQAKGQAAQLKGFKNIIAAALQKVKTAKPDEPFHYLLCDAKPFPYLIIAKTINAGHRKLLEKASGGSKRFLKPDTITFEDGHYVFASQKDIPGQARKIQGSLKNLLGKKYQVMFGTQKASDDDEAGGAEQASAAEGRDTGEQGEAAFDENAPFSIKGTVGRGGKNQPQDVQAVQNALNRKASAALPVDGKCGPATIKAIMEFQEHLGKFKPDGLIQPGRGTARALASSGPMPDAPEPPDPAPPPKLPKGTLDKAPDAWRNMHSLLGRNIGECKKAVRSNYASEHPDLVKAIEEALAKLDQILPNLEPDFHGLLAEAQRAKNAAERTAKLRLCKARIAKHIAYVKSEPLIRHIDKNPFGVQTNLAKILTDHFVHIAQAIGTVG